jgi:excisionase family DNA binding protein
MVDISKKRFLTTGNIAELCGVNFRTVVRWIHRGHLKAHQLPGRGDNRVAVKDFIAFLRENGMPIPEELQPPVPKVLIVEDDEKMAKAMQRALKRKGFETMVASEGFLAGTLALIFKPMVITLDLKMPGLGGLEVLKAIRDLPDLADVKVLVVSAMPRDQLDEAMAAGADDVLDKPFRNKKLVEKVAELADVELES